MLEALRRRAGRFGLDIIFINVWEGPDAAAEARRYCEMWGIEATVLVDETAAFARTLDVRGVPTDVFVDEHGVVQAVGASGTQDLLRQAARLAPGVGDEPDPEPLWGSSQTAFLPDGAETDTSRAGE